MPIKKDKTIEPHCNFKVSLEKVKLIFHGLIGTLSRPKGFPVDEQNRLALDRVKSISALSAHSAVKGLKR